MFLYVATSIPFFIDIRSIPRSNTCGMTYSAPIYKSLPFHAVDPSMAHTYAKYTFAQLFMDGADKRNDSQPLSGVPVLFVPGHLGSYKQARSLGQHLADLHADIDLFLLDFNEEATGMAGQFVLEQGFFLNEAIKEILAMYTSLPADRRPSSVVVIGHSMGGIVTRTALTLPNYNPQSILTIVTLSTPHVAPPFNLDAAMTAVYATVNSLRQPPPPSCTNATSPSCGHQDDVVIVSLAGGLKDFVVHSSLASIAHVVPPSNGFAALTSLLPAVKSSMDHLCILWCHEFMRVLSTALVRLVDPVTHQLRTSPSDRVVVLHDALLGPDGDVWDHHLHVSRGFTTDEVAQTGGVLSFELPLYIFRTQYLVPFPLLALVALAMLATQVEWWQLDRPDTIPTFLALLAPSVHWSALVNHSLRQAHLGHQSRGIQMAGVGTAAVALVATLYALDQLYSAYIVLLCYLYLLGFLHVVTFALTAFVRMMPPSRVTISSPRLLTLLTSRLALAGFGAAVVAGGHVFFRAGVHPTRELALVVLACLAIHVLLVLSALVAPTSSRSVQHVTYQRTLFAFYFGVSPCWIGDLVYFADVVQFPRSLDLSFVLHVLRSLALLLPCVAHVYLSRQWMFPLPPDAVFARLQGGVRQRPPTSGSTSTQIVLAPDQCTECFVEDGGVGAVFEAVDTVDTIHLSDDVVVGPTFRVVACDCGLRNLPSRDFCLFCKRLCSTCGGGEGARRQAHAFRDYMNNVQDQVVAHQGIPLFLWIVLVVGFGLVAQTPHVLLYVGTAVGAIFSLYHTGLRGPLDTVKATGASSSTPWMEDTRK
ncbi:hypothetical protein DYB25_009445 [Aphanomyces astaci]|uniref:GPI inositol-deacylase n=1 Tax=Aphanomyces astaci TaxID=112090 RepID=A0A397D2E3_APHAT|nr:hypothetical protein DYB25_009445 [Aphanomyces astaci]RHY57399.1 hypothetical protein DYB30_001544 [Aphanomyces astaci]